MTLSIMPNDGIRFRDVEANTLFTFEDNLYCKVGQDYAGMLDKQLMSFPIPSVKFNLDEKVRKVSNIIVIEK